VERIVELSEQNIRSVLKSEDQEAIERQLVVLRTQVFHCLKTFTGIDFSKMQSQVSVGLDERGAPIRQKESQVYLSECAEFILKRFPMLSVFEIKEAFSLWAANVIEAECVAYGGRLPVGQIGNVLAAYLSKRKKVLGAYHRQLDLLEARSKDAEAEQKNQAVHQQILTEYRALVKRFTETGDLTDAEKRIKAFWGKILVQELGVIQFSEEEKAEIVQEAKALIKKETLEKAKNPDLPKTEREDIRKMVHYWQKKADLSAFRDKYDPKSIESILKPLEDGFKESSFRDKVVQRYSILIVLKGIVKESLNEEE